MTSFTMAKYKIANFVDVNGFSEHIKDQIFILKKKMTWSIEG